MNLENNLSFQYRNCLFLQENPYALFLAGKMRRDFAKYPMIAIFHTDSYTGQEFQSVIRNIVNCVKLS